MQSSSYPNRRTQTPLISAEEARSIHRKIAGSGFLGFLFVRHGGPNGTAGAGVCCHASHLQHAVPEAEMGALIRGCQQARRGGGGKKKKKSIKLSMKMESKTGWVGFSFLFLVGILCFGTALTSNSALSLPHSIIYSHELGSWTEPAHLWVLPPCLWQTFSIRFHSYILMTPRHC